MKHPKRRIETVRVGNAAVKIYRRTRTVDGNRYPTFEVCDYTGGRRRLRSFADHQAAQREARRIAGLLAKDDAVAAALSGQEAASFARCLELLRAVGDPPRRRSREVDRVCSRAVTHLTRTASSQFPFPRRELLGLPSRASEEGWRRDHW